MNVCCIIKPDGLRHTGGILTLLTKAGIHIQGHIAFTYTNEIVHNLYDHMSESARQHIAAELTHMRGIALRLEVRSIEAMLGVAGRESDPQKCAPSTIRYCFGKHSEPTLAGTDFWWQNAFHRPIDDREAKRDMLLFFPVS